MGKRADILKAALNKFRISLKIVSVAYFICIIIFVSPIFINYILYRERILFIELYIPGVDHHTFFGYILTTIMQLIMTFYGGVAYIIIDIMIISYSYFILILNQMFKIQIDELAEILKNKDEKTIFENRTVMKKLLKEIFLSHLYILE